LRVQKYGLQDFFGRCVFVCFEVSARGNHLCTVIIFEDAAPPAWGLKRADCPYIVFRAALCVTYSPAVINHEEGGRLHRAIYNLP
jgi:hypothetical protein